jgi:ABC-2 type transport system permease protein
MPYAKTRDRFAQLLLTHIRELVRDKMTFFFVLVFPFLFILIFLFVSLANGKTTYTLGVVVPAHPDAQVQALLTGLKQSPELKLVYGTEADQRAQVLQGLENVVLILPDHLNDSATLRILSNSAGTSESSTLQAIIMQATRPTKGPTVSMQMLGKTAYDPLHYSLPGVLVMAFASLGLFGLATPLILLRQRGTLRLLGLTPLSPINFVAAQILARLFIALIQLILILILSYFILGGVPLANLPGIFLSALLGIVMLFSLGYVLGEVISSPEAAGGMIGGLLAPVLMLTGILIPFSILPDAVLTIARFIPLTYLGDALRQQMLGDVPVAPLVIDNLVMLGTSIVLIVLAVRLFRWNQPEMGAKKTTHARQRIVTA